MRGDNLKFDKELICLYCGRKYKIGINDKFCSHPCLNWYNVFKKNKREHLKDRIRKILKDNNISKEEL
ncbi:unnamed protein product [marine sediment metagenome]|uniref:Uncharacterized protein n=1 Tax=marine sediment metagenome TaxID=412755 RepID=X1F1L5_9ZZZZ